MTGAGKYQRLDLASVARRAAEEALERRFGARHQPRPRWGGAKIRRKKTATPPAAAAKRQRACGICGELGHRADSDRHKGADAPPSAVTEPAPPAPAVAAEVAPPIPAAAEVVAPAAAPAARARVVRACSICGELGHRADNPRHKPARPVVAEDSAAARESGGDSAEGVANPTVADHARTSVPKVIPAAAEDLPPAPLPRAAPRAPKRAAQAEAPRRSFLPVLPAPSVAPPEPLVRADELDEVLREAGGEGEDRGGGDEEAAPLPSMRPLPVESAGPTGEEGAVEPAGTAPVAPERLRWTPGPGGEDEHVPALVGERKITALAVLSDEEAEAILPRPRTRADCENVPRPCPFVSCAHHLFLDVNEDTGTIKLNHPTKEPWELVETCALDVADAGGITLDGVGVLVGLSRERIRQVEDRALAKLRRGVPAAGEVDSAGPALRHPYGEVAA